ncbi:MAG: hypothetical protein ACI35N_04010 [Marinilabiliaceae bacterium]
MSADISCTAGNPMSQMVRRFDERKCGGDQTVELPVIAIRLGDL